MVAGVSNQRMILDHFGLSNMAAGLVLRIFISFLLSSTYCSICCASEESTCANCLGMSDEVARARIDDIKATILKKLGLKSPPNVHVSPKMKPTLEKIARFVESEAHSDAAFSDEAEAKLRDETIIFGQQLPKRVSGKRAFTFRLSADLGTKEVIAGSLKFQLRRIEPMLRKVKGEQLECAVKEVLTSDKLVSIGYHTSHVHGELPEYTKVSLDVDDIQRWVSDQESVTLVVEAKYGQKDALLYPSSSDEYTVFLEIITVDRKERRKRETRADICDATKKIKTCCRYDLIIDFHKAGWDFVQFPPTYNAYICLGECKRNHPNRSAYSLLASGVSETTAGCCHPGEFEELDVTYFTEQQTLIRTRVPNLVARNCVCG